MRTRYILFHQSRMVASFESNTSCSQQAQNTATEKPHRIRQRGWCCCMTSHGPEPAIHLVCDALGDGKLFLTSHSSNGNVNWVTGRSSAQNHFHLQTHTRFSWCWRPRPACYQVPISDTKYSGSLIILDSILWGCNVLILSLHILLFVVCLK